MLLNLQSSSLLAGLLFEALPGMVVTRSLGSVTASESIVKSHLVNLLLEAQATMVPAQPWS